MNETYYTTYGKSGNLWLVGEMNVWVWIETDPNGMEGDYMTFKLEDGSKLKLKGPWCSNPRALYEDTGIDFFQRGSGYGQ